MQADNNALCYTPAQAQTTDDLCDNMYVRVKSCRKSISDVCPTALSVIRRVIDFDVLEAPPKRKSKIAKRSIVKDKASERISILKLR